MQQGAVRQIVPQQNYGNICKKYTTAIGVPCIGKSNWVFAFADGACGRARACKGRQAAVTSDDMCAYLWLTTLQLLQLKTLQVRRVIS